MNAGARLGIDFGTSHTVGMLAVDGRPPTPLLFDGSPLLPSAVWADPSGRLIVGRDAQHAAQTDPAGYEPHPKRHIDEETMLLGTAQPSVESVIGTVLGHVAAEAGRVAGRPVGTVVLTHPAAWATQRRQRLEAAARTVFPEVTLVPEPVAAASYVVRRAAGRIPPGGQVVVYDFGAGTFDVSVVRAEPHGLRVVASEGLDDTGGTDVDAAVVELLARTYAARDPATWQRLAAPAGRADRRAARTLWDGARTAKEVLSRATSTVLHVPIFDEEAPLGREQLDQAARPILERTLVATRRVVAGAGGTPAAIFLVGGASRMPLTASLLYQALGVRPTLLDQPELVVAEGALYATTPTASPPPAVPAPGVRQPPAGPWPTGHQPGGQQAGGPQAGGHPPVAHPARSAPIPPQGGHPPVPSQGGYPPVSPQGGHPPVPSQGGHSPVSPQGGHPPVPSQGGHSPVSPQGGHPPVPSQGGHSPVSPQGGHPPVPSQGGHSPVSPQGGYPRVMHAPAQSPGYPPAAGYPPSPPPEHPAAPPPGHPAAQSSGTPPGRPAASGYQAASPPGYPPVAPVSGADAPVSGGMAPATGIPASSARRGLVIAIAVVSVLTLALATSLTVRAAATGSWPFADGPSPAPSVSPGLDPCVVGVWKQQKYVIENTIDGEPTDFTGYDTGTDTYRADGTYEVVYSGSPFKATVRGDNWEHIVTGSITGRYTTTGGELTATDATASGTSKLLLNGKLDNSRNLTTSDDPSSYECDDDTLVIYGTFYGVELTRTAETP
ncbi:actin-like ATPase involved in cell morphogenesis [Catenuloplanes nepalensis]|uniref:Actin-like ATPase involved in cell morphogenesis n=1 Tax=Catenuloplanes nepalensis TaxID=587533 RepID=A0ABT9MTH8_9ACTN|nr:Hsp70 family protein [Catenuloplanes nepalensis]MDP9794689.1 actin-like ATPase involved in cell morphogenesis [Catenuloplanes nepalensis]